jgi:hypothetical protein
MTINPHSLLLEYHYGNRVQVEGKPDLKKDPKTGAVVNTNKTEYEDYIRNRDQKRADKAEIESLKGEIKELKELLYQVLNK